MLFEALRLEEVTKEVSTNGKRRDGEGGGQKGVRRIGTKQP